MKPVVVATQVHAPIELVFDQLQTLANHEAFTDHVLVDWTFAGPTKGVGAKARVRTTGLGPSDAGDIEIVAVDEHDWSIVERATGAGGERQTTGTYALFPITEDVTEVQFKLSFDLLPGRERAMGPLMRRLLRRANQRALDRLSAQYPAGAFNRAAAA